MRLLAAVRSWFGAMFHRARTEREMDAELRAHIDAHAQDLVRSGVARQQAMRRARMEFGGMERVKEECRESRGVTFIESLLQDLRFGLRMLRKSPGFTTVAVLTLALGIGTNTSIFSAVNGILLKPLPYADPSRLVKVERAQIAYSISNAQWQEIQKECTALEDLARSYDWSTSQINGDAMSEEVSIVEVSDNFFTVLGMKPLLGRFILPQDLHAGNEHAAVLNYRLWMTEFGGDPNIVGHKFTVDQKSYTVIGVMPKEFGIGIDWSYRNSPAINEEMWVPRTSLPQNPQDPLPSRFIARLRKGSTLAQANAQLRVLSRRLATTYPPGTEGLDFTAEILNPEIQSSISTGLWILMGAVGFVLLMASVNVASLLIARSWTRQREMAIRKALGASRFRIARQLLAEILLLAIAGGALGLLFSLWGIRLIHLLAPAQTPRIDFVQLNSNVLWFTLGASLLAAVFVGLAPAIQASSRCSGGRLPVGLSNSFTGFSTARIPRFRSVLVVLEVLIAVIVVAGAGLMGRSLYKLLNLDTGMNAGHIITMNLKISSPACAQSPATGCEVVIGRIEDATRSISGVKAAALSDSGVFQGGLDIGHYPGSGRTGLYVEGLPGDRLPLTEWIEGRSVTPDFFATLGIRILKGRDFGPADLSMASEVVSPLTSTEIAKSTDGHHIEGSKGSSSSKKVRVLKVKGVVSSHAAIVSERFADEFIAGNPIGRFFSTNEDNNGQHDWKQIVGVVNDVRDHTLSQRPPEPVYYEPIEFGCDYYCEVVARTSANPTVVVPAIERAIRSVDAGASFTKIETVDQMITESSATPRFQTFLLGSFGVLGLLLAIIGIYGVISYSVVQRTHEIGVRMALGAGRGDVMRMILGEGLLLAIIGIAIGIAGALALTRFLRTLLFEITSTDPTTFIGVAILLALVALAACYVPARRAMKVDPMVALRYE